MLLCKVSRDGLIVGPQATLATEITFSAAFSALRPPIGVADAKGEFLTVYTRLQGGVVAPTQRPGWTFGPTDDSVLEPVATVAMEEPIFGTASLPSVAGTQSDALVVSLQADVFLERRETEVRVVGASVASGRAPLRRTIAMLATQNAEGIPPLAVNSLRTAVASDGLNDFVIAWSYFTSRNEAEPNEIQAIRYRRGDGPHVADETLLVAGGPEGKALGGVSFAAGEFLVVWVERRALFGQHVGLDGTGSETFEIDSGPVTSDVALASDGRSTLVLFARPTSFGENSVDIEGVFVE